MMLSEIIIQRIKKEGPISFRDFMEMSLYYPELGYYTSKKDKIGVNGDFYTSSNLTSAFGAMIARQLEEMWNLLGQNPFTIVEYGAGTGSLCHDVLDYLKNNGKLYEKLKYCIIEKSPTMREIEKTHLHEKVSWYDSIQDIPEINGCIISNELVDNFSVHQVVMDDELMEVFVDYKNGFIELLKPAGKALTDYMSELNVALPKGFQTEINLEAIEWIKEIAASLKKGYIMTIDYGYTSSELYSNRRSCGTIVCYNKHRINDYPYRDIGEQDITTHVNFSALCHWGLKNGMECCGFTDQAHFLLALGFKDYHKIPEEKGQNIASLALKEAFLTHTLLMDMGSKYKVLIQQKGIPKLELSGLKFS
ncbi:class I SAM-dependent methyltransferase [Flavobacterium sp.]|uniref:class I SAM-dependent methyltransferase n=1 Tax=Flavobacterium sp. TaxID=239 RepID=UPI002B4ABD62|nr:SAM-dependent methyltransferase [Flavobacterium sp.]HLF52386.1 SAM-dependent methyltransferase [Flavobacterium sp.]